ncbi:MAG: hypothetical protein HOJ34_01760 [Kordiimonadaceae bacterium]|jgi:hypothetical protein|nr:hypothetical protein [Kordiimonadaceae bacterium]MBT6036166.1 hypothetical protein [Kordiimonadaceae bacterium]MBT6328482.1 hypothetical protein [Kordiimonadaceae bacterium]MBT7581574.1 hypothetical protein [Kordiimonadaceae bacterium]
MKVKLEAQKTSIRLSKDEFQKLLNTGLLDEQTTFPGGNSLTFKIELDIEQNFSFKDNEMLFVLPDQLLHAYKPSKSGLSLKFHVDSNQKHELVFEVDIKKPPLSSNNKS